MSKKIQPIVSSSLLKGALNHHSQQKERAWIHLVWSLPDKVMICNKAFNRQIFDELGKLRERGGDQISSGGGFGSNLQSLESFFSNVAAFELRASFELRALDEPWPSLEPRSSFRQALVELRALVWPKISLRFLLISLLSHCYNHFYLTNKANNIPFWFSPSLNIL